MPSGQLQGGRTLADLIMEKLDAQNEEKQAKAGKSDEGQCVSASVTNKFSSLPSEVREPPPGYNPKIVEVYTK
jgi:essential nuclear protein 1